MFDETRKAQSWLCVCFFLVEESEVPSRNSTTCDRVNLETRRANPRDFGGIAKVNVNVCSKAVAEDITKGEKHVQIWRKYRENIKMRGEII